MIDWYRLEKRVSQSVRCVINILQYSGYAACLFEAHGPIFGLLISNSKRIATHTHTQQHEKHGPSWGRELRPSKTIRDRETRLSAEAMEDFICCLQRDYGARRLVIHDVSDPKRPERSLKIEISWSQMFADRRFNILSVGDSMAEREAARRGFFWGNFSTTSQHISAIFFRQEKPVRKASAGLEKKACRAGEPMCRASSLKNRQRISANLCTSAVFCPLFRPWCKTIKFQVWIQLCRKNSSTIIVLSCTFMYLGGLCQNFLETFWWNVGLFPPSRSTSLGLFMCADGPLLEDAELGIEGSAGDPSHKQLDSFLRHWNYDICSGRLCNLDRFLALDHARSSSISSRFEKRTLRRWNCSGYICNIL